MLGSDFNRYPLFNIQGSRRQRTKETTPRYSVNKHCPTFRDPWDWLNRFCRFRKCRPLPDPCSLPFYLPQTLALSTDFISASDSQGICPCHGSNDGPRQAQILKHLVPGCRCSWGMFAGGSTSLEVAFDCFHHHPTSTLLFLLHVWCGRCDLSAPHSGYDTCCLPPCLAHHDRLLSLRNRNAG